MKIRADNIPDDGKRVSVEIAPPSDTEESFQAGFTGKGTLEINLELNAGLADPEGNRKVSVKGSISGEHEVICARCGTPVSRAVNIAVDKVFVPAAQAGGADEHAEHRLEKEDLTTDFYDTGEIDLDMLIFEELVIDTPAIFVCKEECLGICPVCGVNRNEIPCGCVLEEEPEAPEAIKGLSELAKKFEKKKEK